MLPAGVTPFFGCCITAHGFDNMAAGITTILNHKAQDTFTSQFLQQTGMSQNQANLCDVGLSIAGIFGGALLQQSAMVCRVPIQKGARHSSAIICEGESVMGKSSLNSAKNNTPLNEYFVSDKRAPHIFRDKVGHFKINNLENRNLLKELANDSKSVLGTDRFGFQWNAKKLSNGEQIWIRLRGKEILNGGINKIPREFNNITGLDRLKK